MTAMIISGGSKRGCRVLEFHVYYKTFKLAFHYFKRNNVDFSVVYGSGKVVLADFVFLKTLQRIKIISF